MKKVVLVLIIVPLIILGIPLWVFRGFSEVRDTNDEGSALIRILDKKSKKVTALPLEEYLVGVVAAEMPANFELEALKAQAVAARTYAVKRMFTYGAKPIEGHMDGEICTDPSHCQAWSSTTELRGKWGQVKYYFYLAKVKKAVAQTRGEIITYNGQPVEPVYHGSCGGLGTENAGDVWSSHVPYLVGVECSMEYRAEDQVSISEFDRKELMDILRISGKKNEHTIISVNTSSAGLDGAVETMLKSPVGRIKEAKLFGVPFSGSELRQLLGLTSTYVTWVTEGDKIKFTSTGKGHAVGMCQYGANGMARNGKSKEEIISHYYTGVHIEKLKY